ncbi:efflux transporter outer membrane subunit [Allosphingosinicella deserti]|uniref:RND transporter n=1 Tax=Allosphingosinicella deserti TaxID=2116704 RepID=A0A2P7QLX8_9SPHN|nr:efflux transporter outer membrane subunit [Sphingomonas deserti]PSJ38950.1 RND transporter [Sphingomonas deserti]
MRHAVAVALGLILAGCAGRTPAPVPPEAAVRAPSGWRTHAGPTAPIERQWWQRFGDPVLAALVEQALVNNPDVGLAAARVREARAQERLARSQLAPSLDLGVGATYGRTVSALGQPTTSASVQPIFQTAYEVDLFGRIDQQVAAARAGTAAAEAGRETAALSIAAATASGYITLRGLDARLGIVRETLTSRAEALRIARNRAEVGYTSELELRQAEAEYEATAQIVPQVELAVSRQENALSQLIGGSPRTIERGVALAALRAPPVPDGLPADLLRRRPDIAQAEFTLAASDATLAAARAQFLPQIRLTGSAGEVLSSALGNPISLWSIGGSILAPIFNGGRIQAQVDTAAARRDQAAFAYRRTALVAFREVEDNLAAVRRLAEQRARLEAQRAAVAEALRHATNRYQAGYSPYLEQLDAQRALLNVELSLVQIGADQLNALVALYQAMGGGWTGVPAAATAESAQ